MHMKKGKIKKNPITGGSNGVPALKNEKKKVITKKIVKRKYSFENL